MMKKWFKGICGMLCIIGMIGGTPNWKPMVVRADMVASTLQAVDYLEYKDPVSRMRKYRLNVEKGQKGVDLSELVYYITNNGDPDTITYMSEVSGDKYVSSDPSIVSVSKTGKLTLKKVDQVNVTVSYQNRDVTFRIYVYEKGSLKLNRAGSKVTRQRANKFIATYQKGVTLKNCYSLYNQLDTLLNDQGETLIWGRESRGDGLYNVIVYPELAKVYRMNYRLKEYITKNNPLIADGKSAFKIASVSGKGSTITIKLKKKVSAVQLFAMKANHSLQVNDTYLTANSKTCGRLQVKDTVTGKTYQAIATVKKGSNIITVEMTNTKLKAKRKYSLVAGYRYPSYVGLNEAGGTWLQDKTFRAK